MVVGVLLVAVAHRAVVAQVPRTGVVHQIAVDSVAAPPAWVEDPEVRQADRVDVLVVAPADAEAPRVPLVDRVVPHDEDARASGPVVRNSSRWKPPRLAASGSERAMARRFAWPAVPH